MSISSIVVGNVLLKSKLDSFTQFLNKFLGMPVYDFSYIGVDTIKRHSSFLTADRFLQSLKIPSLALNPAYFLKSTLVVFVFSNAYYSKSKAFGI